MSNEDDVKLDRNGRPFTTEDKALSALKTADLSGDVWGVYPRDGGYAIVKHIAQMAFSEEAKQASNSTARNRGFANEKYLFVEYPERGSSQEPEFVELSWEGNRITVTRGVKVPMAGRFLGVCDTAVQQIYEPAPREAGVAFRKAGFIKRRPYRIIGPATKEDFDAYMREGNSITKGSFAKPTNAAS